jgi:hypothetical protein
MVDLEGFSLVVLGGMWSAGSSFLRLTDVRNLQDHGVLVIAHLPLATAVRVSPQAASVASPSDGAAATSGADPRRASSPELILALARSAAEHGFDGVYLDDLDVAAPASGRHAKFCMLVRSIREQCPNLLLMAQRSPASLASGLVDAFGHDAPLLEAAVAFAVPGGPLLDLPMTARNRRNRKMSLNRLARLVPRRNGADR